MSRNDNADAIAGAKNLLENCLSVRSGEQVLIIGEDCSTAHFDAKICDVVCNVASGMGLKSEKIIVGETRGAGDFPDHVTQAMQHADHTVFFARLGDQLRFCPLPGKGTKTMCYTLDSNYLANDFAKAHFTLTEKVLDELLKIIAGARTFRITCRNGTDLNGELPPQNTLEEAITDFSVKLFPTMIFPPVTCAAMSGDLVLQKWLTSSSTNVYEDSVFELKEDVIAKISHGTITEFIGPQEEANRVKRHFEHVGKFAGGDPFAINSWHTGINPGTFYSANPIDDPEKWGTVAYGSPRFTHFHGCGNDPGDIAICLLDATISFDDRTLWRDGRFVFLDDPSLASVRQKCASYEAMIATPGDIRI